MRSKFTVKRGVMPHSDQMTLPFHPSKLLADIQDQTKKAWTTVNKIQNLGYYLSSDRDYYDEEHDMTQLEFESQLQKLYVAISLLLESLGLSSLLAQFQQDYAKFNGKLTDLDMLPYIGEFHSEVLGLFWRYHSSLSALLGEEAPYDEERRKQFESILINTPKIIKDRGIDPSKEAEVRKCVFDLLIHVFADTVREIPIVQVTKTYKPDIGIKSLKMAAEYKFADSDEEVKKAVGGFYEDMRGYAGSEDWKQFYAVIYMTDAFFTQEQIMAEFKHTAADKNWRPILVVGKGQRKRRAA